MIGPIQQMSPAERLRAAAIIMRDAVEKIDTDRAEYEARGAALAVAS
ncbi:hypothetical protein [Microbacterium sp. IEGM 1404]|nr:hypothetical protein [Microbacterium sp. IEGM 1404]MDI9889929.1 hypothetical protein [Microbacterium sp. IEGM 1404]